MSASPEAASPGIVVVAANRAWTDTGVDVRMGDCVSFETSGEVRLSFGAADASGAGGSQSGRGACNAPVPQAPAGVLIARIGGSDAFDVGSRTAPIRAPRAGRLFLGINDDYTPDNTGSLRVRVVVVAAPR